MVTELSSTKGRVLAPVLVHGFATAIAVWVAWFVTHLPWLKLPESSATPVVLGVWGATLFVLNSRLPRKRVVPVGIASSVVAAMLGLLILGSKLAKPADASSVSPGVVPSAPLIALGFVGLGLGIGVVAALAAWPIARAQRGDLPASMWLGRFAVVMVLGMAPLLFVGGLVTSTNTGMAVPDWPNTFGGNMFLYPLASHTDAGIYFEHSHRLFGTLTGITAITLLLFTMFVETRRWVKVMVLIAFLLVVAQGIVGGLRVLADSRWGAVVHGVSAQLIFGLFAAIAVVMSSRFRSVIGIKDLLASETARRIRVFSTAATHALILQLVFGAMYRHLRSPHALWSHIGFSVIVAGLAVFAGFILMSQAVRTSSVGVTLNRVGGALVAVVSLQFLLGWAAFLAGGAERTAGNPLEALIRTAHQANGAILIACAVMAFVWGRRLTSK